MAYTVSGTPSASAQTLNKAFQGIIDLPNNLREIEKEEYQRKLAEENQTRAKQYADVQLRLMNQAYQDKINAQNTKAKLVNAFATSIGNPPDIFASNIAPYLVENGNIGDAINLYNAGNTYNQSKQIQNKKQVEEQAIDNAISSWLANNPRKQTTYQDVAMYAYGNKSLSPQARSIAIQKLTPFISNSQTQVKFGEQGGQPYAINANGTVSWGTRPPSQKIAGQTFPKFIYDQTTGQIIPLNAPKSINVNDGGGVSITEGGVNPEYANVWARLNGYSVPLENTNTVPVSKPINKEDEDKIISDVIPQ